MARSAKSGELVTFRFGAETAYPTGDGRSLRFAAGVDIDGILSLRRAYREHDPDPDDEEAAWTVEVYAADLLVADEGGRLWRATSHFSSDVFLAAMNNLSWFGNDGALWPVGPSRGRRKRPEPALTAAYLNDDRVGRNLIVHRPSPGRRNAGHSTDEPVIVPISGKYLCVVFEVFIEPAAELPATLRVEVCEGSLLDDTTGEDLGRFQFSMPWFDLFRHNDMAPGPEGPWRGSNLALPIVFSPVSGSGNPQVAVYVH